MRSVIVLCAAAVLSLWSAAADTGREHIELKGDWKADDGAWGASNVVWRSFRADVPLDWTGRRVRVEIPGALHKCDAVVYVNGERAGDILRPGFEGVDATRFVRPGQANEIRFLLTESGAETARGATRAVTRVHGVKKGPDAVAPRLSAYAAAFVADVFANTSWRRKRIDFEVETDSSLAAAARIVVEVFDTKSNAVRRLEKPVGLKRGLNRTVLTMPWDGRIVAWELGRPALYVCRTALIMAESNAPSRDEFPPFRFGCREVWREGREIMMNGHKAHFRPTFTFQSQKWGLKYLQDIGYNVGFWGHSVNGAGFSDCRRYDAHDELGMGMYASMGAQDTIGAGSFHRDAALRKEFERFIRAQHRLTRNHPALLAGIVSQMTICETGTAPDRLGQHRATGDRVEQIELACELHRRLNPNILYFSHADGTCGDMASANLYLNFTPLQEREEWLCSWTTNGILPWCSIEFGQPYNGNFWKQGVFLPTEFLAMFYGERAYAEEPPETLARMVGSTRWRHHGQMKGDLLYKGLPLYWDLRSRWTRRLNERWRAYGLNGGNLWFNITEAYGEPPGGWGIYWRYYPMKEEVVGRPAWANEGYDIHRQGNQDFCAFLGGSPDFADSTHAYRSGETVAKQLVLLWDGIGEKEFRARWRAVTADGAKVSSGEASAKVAQGERKILPLSFLAPETQAVESLSIEVDFSADGVEPIADRMDIEVYPAEAKPLDVPERRHLSVALLDPEGKSAEMLKMLGVAFRTVDSPGDVRAGDTHLVVGRNALGNHRLDILYSRISNGLRLLVLRQTPEVWQRLGFRVQDVMSRELFLRNVYDQAFSEITPKTLSCWRGTPDYPNGPFGALMRHAKQRGPRGSRRHTVAGLLLQTPDRIGYTPLVVGGFDLNYSALLNFAPGGTCKGDVTYCTFDFEERLGVCPAAMATARATFGAFLSARQRSQCGELAICDEEKARKAGFKLGKERVYYSAAMPGDAVFRGVGQGELRWPTGLKMRPLVGKGASADGLFAVRREGGRTLVFSQIPLTLAKTAKPAAPTVDEVVRERANAECLDAAKIRRLYAQLATNLDTERPDEVRAKALRRALHQSGRAEFSPLPAMHVLGPFSAGKDDSRLILDTPWSRQGEAMAIAGDFNPNIEFTLPQGGKANWRTMLSPTREGVFDFDTLFPPVSFPVAYAICRVVRRQAGDAILRFGMDWRARVWCNAREVFRSESGAPRMPRFEIRLPLKAGENILSFKIGAGRCGFQMTGLLEAEHPENEPPPDPEIDSISLYGASVPGFDPWEFVYW